MNGDMIGRVIKDRYKLIDERGRGSFATVYVARDITNNRIHAIKVMHPELSSEDELIARFQREAHILLNLRDPHIVQIFDYGYDQYAHYIVMDYIDGHSLKYHILKELGQGMDPLRALSYAQQMGEGLQCAYKQGVVHRDIKPQNMLLTSEDMVKITDFGLARSQDTESVTQSNVFMGTAFYISPEQAESGKLADTRSDLYSVAAVLFEMLTGRPPFEGETALDIVIKHMNDAIPSARRYRPELPIEVDQFFQRALAKNPNDRYPNPIEFNQALALLIEKVKAMPVVEKRVPKQEASPSRPPIMESLARFVVLSTGEVFHLKQESMVVGRRDPTLGIYPEIHLADKTVGRRHAYIHFQQGNHSVEDLNALNKTRLNGVTLAPHEEHSLKDGDVLRFGSVEVRFEKHEQSI